MADRHFICSLCGETKLSARHDDAEAVAEAIENFGNVPDIGEDLVATENWAILCDDCYQFLGSLKDPKEWTAEQN